MSSTATANQEDTRRWWLVTKEGLAYEVEIIAWQESGAIVFPQYPGFEGKPIFAKLSELQFATNRPPTRTP